MNRNTSSRWLARIALAILACATLAQMWLVVEVTVWHLSNASAVPVEVDEMLDLIAPALVGAVVIGYLGTVIAILRRRALVYVLPVPLVMFAVLCTVLLQGGGF